jgi:hypothetical protein
MSTMVVNNSTNVNSDGQQFHQYQQNQEHLISDGQQFRQYQQSEQSPHLNSLSKRKTKDSDI